MNITAKNKKNAFPCDWKRSPEKRIKESFLNTTRFFKYRGNFTWQGILTEKYKPGGDEWSDIIRQTLIGNHGESAKFHLRYFEIAPDGFSSFEMHKHEHVVIGIRGQGICIAGKKRYKIGFLDTVYIKPSEPHQLKNTSNQPFGFFCIVNAKRDRPKIIRKNKDYKLY
jgi:quercetin dioxygenase-like cupin family protein